MHTYVRCCRGGPIHIDRDETSSVRNATCCPTPEDDLPGIGHTSGDFGQPTNLPRRIGLLLVAPPRPPLDNRRYVVRRRRPIMFGIGSRRRVPYAVPLTPAFKGTGAWRIGDDRAAGSGARSCRPQSSAMSATPSRWSASILASSGHRRAQMKSEAPCHDWAFLAGHRQSGRGRAPATGRWPWRPVRREGC